jgi:hypothetical protein
MTRVCGIVAAVLFALFVLAGIDGLVHTWPAPSCAGVVGQYGQGPVELAGSGWQGVPSTDCVQVDTATDRAANLGPAPGAHQGEGWVYARWGIAAWIAWCLGMVLLALAVAALPRRARHADGPPAALASTGGGRGTP